MWLRSMRITVFLQSGIKGFQVVVVARATA